MVSALAPVFAAIILGYALSRFHFPGDEFWPHAERITYYLLFPALLVNKLSSARFDQHVLPMACAILAVGLAAALVLLALRKRLGLDGPAFSSVFQGSLRGNSYVGLAGAAALFGDTGIALSALVLMVTVPLHNVLCVSVVARFGSSGNGRGAGLFLELARNPLILGCLCGFALNATHLPLPEAFHETLAVIGRAALPLGLLAVGAGLRFSSMGSQTRGIVFATAFRLGVQPLMAILFLSLAGVHGPAFIVAVLFCALPTASSSFILARQLGGDTGLMASVITVQTLVSALTIPLVLGLLAY